MKKGKLHVVIYCAILLPFLTILILSFGQQWFFPSILPGKLTLANWNILLNDSSILHSMWLSLCIAITVALITTSAGFACSRAIAAHKYQSVLVRILYLPFTLTSIIYGILLQPYFIMLGLSGKVLGVMIGQSLFIFPYTLIYFQSFWTENVREFELLGTTLGATQQQLFLKVLLPMGKSMILVCLFQTFLISWFEYGFTNLIGVGKVKTMTVSIFQYINEANIYYAALAAFLLIIPPVIFLWMNKRFLYNKLL